MDFEGDCLHFETKKNKHSMVIMQPSMVIEPLLSKKRNIYFHGHFWIKDEKTGIKMDIHIGKKCKVTGDFKDSHGKVLDKFEGDLLNGVKLVSSGRVISKAGESNRVELSIPDWVTTDPLYSQNVWKKVFEAMKLSTPDFDTADKEKFIVEEAQRQKKDEQFFSRYGFKFTPKKK